MPDSSRRCLDVIQGCVGKGLVVLDVVVDAEFMVLVHGVKETAFLKRSLFVGVFVSVFRF